MFNKQEVLSLTGLRFLAALYVFVFHFHIRWPVTKNEYISNFLNQGAVGMSFFFILSGFVLAYRYSFVNFSRADYFSGRFSRVYPIYLIVALLSLPWIGVTFSGVSSLDSLVSIAKVSLIIVANILLIQAWFPAFFPLWNNGASWSISVEAFFYLIFPFIIKPMCEMSERRLFKVLLGLIFLSALPGLVALLFSDATSKIFYSIPIFRFPEFLVGIVVCVFFLRGVLTVNIGMLDFLVLSIIFIYLAFFGGRLPLYIGHNWLVVPLVALLIFCLASGGGLLSAFLSAKIFVWLGRISYCFYSFQFFVIVPIISHYDYIVGILPILSRNKILMLVMFFLLILISAIAHHFIEEPLRIFVKKHLRRRYVLSQRTAYPG